MLPKPKHLSAEYAAQFQDQSVVDAYQYRPPYPAEVFAILADLITETPRAVLDAGCGDGAIARNLVGLVERVDAVDPSQAMIEQGRRLPNGDHPNLTWICDRAEDAPLRPPYALVTAGASLHWMEWAVVLPRFRQALTPRGLLAITYAEALPSPWEAALRTIIPRFSTNRDFQPYNLLEELEQRGLFEQHGKRQTAPISFEQSIAAYIESFHARNGFSRERMSQEMAAGFDAKVRELVSPFCPEGTMRLQVAGEMIWGRPLGEFIRR